MTGSIAPYLALAAWWLLLAGRAIATKRSTRFRRWRAKRAAREFIQLGYAGLLDSTNEKWLREFARGEHDAHTGRTDTAPRWPQR